MDSIGIVRTVDKLGRIIIPKITREKLNISQGDLLEVFLDETDNNPCIVLMKYAPGCAICGGLKNTKEFKGRSICRSCLGEIKRMFG